MNSLGQRFKEERNRLKLTQPHVAEITGSSKRAVIDWEKDVSSPTASKLAMLGEVGLDVLYVVTGQRAGGVPALSPREEALLDNYRHSDDAGKRAVEGAARAVSQPEGKVANGKP